MANFSIDHLHLLSRDAMETAKYYEKMFGAKLIPSTGANGLPRCDVDINGQIFRVTTAEPDVRGPAPGPHQQRGVDHIGLHVEDMDTTAAELERLGVEFAIAPKTVRPGVKIAFISAPDGVTIELVQSNEA